MLFSCFNLPARCIIIAPIQMDWAGRSNKTECRFVSESRFRQRLRYKERRNDKLAPDFSSSNECRIKSCMLGWSFVNVLIVSRRAVETETPPPQGRETRPVHAPFVKSSTVQGMYCETSEAASLVIRRHCQEELLGAFVGDILPGSCSPLPQYRLFDSLFKTFRKGCVAWIRPLYYGLHLEVEMNSTILRLALFQVVRPYSVDYLHLALGISCFEIDRWSCVGEVNDAEVSPIQLFNDLLIDVAIVFTPVDDDGCYSVLAENILDRIVVDGVGVRLIERHRYKTSRLSIRRHLFFSVTNDEFTRQCEAQRSTDLVK